MRTSRLARETAKLTEALSPPRVPRRTRSALASFAAADSAKKAVSRSGAKAAPKPSPPSIASANSDSDSDSSALSSANSDASYDYRADPDPEQDEDEDEDGDGDENQEAQPRRRSGKQLKRKRGADTPATTASSKSTTAARASLRKRPATKARVKQEEVEVEVDIEETVAAAPSKKVRSRPAKRAVDPDTGEVAIHPPAQWEEVFEAVRQMRARIPAPVDTMGCDKIAQPDQPPKIRRFQTLVSLMLSSQTKDTVNAMTMKRLYTELPAPGLTLENILAVSPARLNELIGAVGFHNNKTRYIKAAAELLRERHGGDIPDSIDGLTSLPGVGPKMAYLCMSAAWGRDEGIGVDVHVHRITNLWRWHRTNSPEETRRALQAWLPRDRWHEINHMLVGFGQTVCTPLARRCADCDLAAKALCPSAVVAVKRTQKAKKVKKEASVLAAAEADLLLKSEAAADADAVLVKEEELAAEQL